MFDQKVTKSANFHCGKKMMRFKIILDLNRGGEIHSVLHVAVWGDQVSTIEGETSYLRVVPVL